MVMKIKSNFAAMLIPAVVFVFFTVFLVYAYNTSRVDESTVAVVVGEVARLEKLPDAQAVNASSFEYRPGFKGKYIKLDYSFKAKPKAGQVGVQDKSKERYFLVRKPLFGPWEVTYEINQETYEKEFPGSGEPTRLF